MAEIDYFLRFMVDSGASDFHLSSSVLPTLRVDGSIVTATEDSATPFEAFEHAGQNCSSGLGIAGSFEGVASCPEDGNQVLRGTARESYLGDRGSGWLGRLYRLGLRRGRLFGSGRGRVGRDFFFLAR